MARRQRGFSLVELMIVLAILSVVMAVVFRDIDTAQKRYRVEENKLDITQMSREFMDQFVRDLHQAGYPNATMYQAGVLMSPPENDARNGVGLVSVSATDVWFEGDVDGDGDVDSVRYTFQANASGECPCSIQRSQVQKVNATAPTAQTQTYYLALENLVNSGGAGGSGPGGSLNISGNSMFKSVSIANNTLYAGYRSAPLFSAYDQNGVQVTLPVSLTSNPTELARIKTIRITLNVLAPYTDIQTGMRPAISLRAIANI
ncbi:MAG TPA: prepilin-type N-terminal cleavage/methylation domain-containing protein [Terriglobales bacterium]|nr:prepilin-type N-terminal cleavage/methylation domain-containing protein [Terriglobales bacterium]